MKKTFAFARPLCFCLSFLFILSGCGQKIEEMVKTSLSEVHYNYFVGQTSNFNISMWSGVREEPYSADGVSENKVDFCVLNVVPNSSDIDTYGLTDTIEINDKTLTGEFENSPFDSSLATDLKLTLTDTDSIFVYIVWDGQTEIGKMSCISQDFKINYSQALDIALEALQDEILTLTNENKKIETYCKIISTDKNLGVYFWYVDIVNQSGDQVAVVIDNTTGEIVAKK